ncbi:MAG TPA: metallophosphoesterase [Terrimicrobiaceae bacterium]
MSLKGDASETKIRQLEARVAGLRKQVVYLQDELHAARTARAVKPPKPAPKIKRTGDIVRVIIPDSHGSSKDDAAIAAFLADLKEINPDEVIMLGDHIDCGGFLAQHHTLGFVAETEYSYEEDIIATDWFISQIQANAGNAKIEYIEGNHELRIERWAVTETLRNQRDAEMLRRAFAPQFVLKLKERGIPYFRQAEKYDGLPTPGTIKRGKCYFTHGFSTAKHAAAAHLARVGGNIVYGHTHRADTYVTTLVNVGTIGAYNPGALCRLQPMWMHTSPTGWTHGYGVQLVDRISGNFLHLNIPIAEGNSLLRPLLSK